MVITTVMARVITIVMAMVITMAPMASTGFSDYIMTITASMFTSNYFELPLPFATHIYSRPFSLTRC